MSNVKFRAFLDDGPFVLLIMAAALGSAALETAAVIAAWPEASAPTAVAAAPAAIARPPLAAAAPASQPAFAPQLVARWSR